MKRSGFTMIELVFVIVILGVLAAIAIPKLTSTKDDASAVAEVANLRTAKTDLISAMALDDNVSNAPTNNLKCFVLSINSNKLITVTDSNLSDDYCVKARQEAQKANLYESIQL